MTAGPAANPDSHSSNPLPAYRPPSSMTTAGNHISGAVGGTRVGEGSAVNAAQERAAFEAGNDAHVSTLRKESIDPGNNALPNNESGIEDNRAEHETETLVERARMSDLLNDRPHDTIVAAEIVVDEAIDEQQATAKEPSDDFNWSAPKHIFVLSSAGKPVFSLSGDEQHLSTLMGLIQGLLSLCAHCGRSENGEDDEMESISAGDRQFVFLRRGDLVLVAVSSYSVGSAESLGLGEDETRRVPAARPDGNDVGVYHPESEAFLRLQLEYMYSSILFLLTSKVQAVFRRSPGYDLRGLLGGADSSLKGVIDLAEPSRGRGRMLAGGVETVWMDPNIRARVTSGLQAAQSAAAPSALYAIWLCGEELVALAQPRAPSHRLYSQDLLLLVNFVATQPALRNAESWTPVCFPRFQEQGYLYAYIAFLNDPERANGEHLLHDDGCDEREVKSTFPSGHDDMNRNNGRGGLDDRVAHARPGSSCLILVSAEGSAEQFQAFRRARTALEARFRSALGLNWGRYLGTGAKVEREGILNRFCSQLNAKHFFYCLRGRRGGAPCVNQVLSAPFVSELVNDPASQRRIWGHYTRAALRLRRGSSQEGRVCCRDEESERRSSVDGRKQFFSQTSSSGEQSPGNGNGGTGAVDGNASAFAEATAIFEADPVHSLAYEIGATETVVSLYGQRDDGSGGSRWSASAGGGGTGGGSWGERDELHVCFSSSSVSVEAAYKAAVRLVAIIRRDREWLFLTGTGAAK